jgi:hypothetical protein
VSGIEQFRQRLEELTGKQVDKETAAEVAKQYPEYLVANPSEVTGFIAEDLRVFTNLTLTEDVEEVHRQAAGGKLSRYTVIIGGEKPNTTVIDQHIYDPSLVFDSAGVFKDRLSVRLLHVEGEC